MTRTQCQIEEFRQGDACIQVRDDSGRPCAGIPVSVEQESHDFLFGCIVPDLGDFADSDRQRYQARLNEVFNCLVGEGETLASRARGPEHGATPVADAPGSPAPVAGSAPLRVDVAEEVHLGLVLRRLDQLAANGPRLHVNVGGETIGLPGNEEKGAGKRAAELYTLCFAHAAVVGVFWHGFADGEPGVGSAGLLRRDLAPKYAFKVLQKLIAFDWHTRAQGITDAEGRFRFRGFFGDYRLVAKVGGSDVHIARFALNRGPTVPVRI